MMVSCNFYGGKPVDGVYCACRARLDKCGMQYDILMRARHSSMAPVDPSGEQPAWRQSVVCRSAVSQGPGDAACFAADITVAALDLIVWRSGKNLRSH